MTLDIADVYLAIPLAEEFKEYVTFQYQNQTYCFLCMPFGLNNATKAIKHPVAKVIALRFKVLVYLDDWVLAA